ncbi:MAG TPA: hypothetical protein VGT41_03270 [Candidatus Babeliales bacterium]|nr:hypothetical protein [Candidatus Babeliales bacterium]
MKHTITYSILVTLSITCSIQPSAAPEDVEKQKVLHAAAQKARRDAAAQEYRQHIREAMQQSLQKKQSKNNASQSQDLSATPQEDEKEQEDPEITALINANTHASHLLIAKPSEDDDEDEKEQVEQAEVDKKPRGLSQNNLIRLVQKIAHGLPWNVDRIIYSFLKPSVLGSDLPLKETIIHRSNYGTIAFCPDSNELLFSCDTFVSSSKCFSQNSIIKIYNSYGEQLLVSEYKTILEQYSSFPQASSKPSDDILDHLHHHDFLIHYTQTLLAPLKEIAPIVSTDNQFMIRWFPTKHEWFASNNNVVLLETPAVWVLYTALPLPSVGAYMHAQPFITHAQELRAQAKSMPSFPQKRMTKINYGIARLKQSITSQRKDLKDHISLIYKRTAAEFSKGKKEARQQKLKCQIQ